MARPVAQRRASPARRCLRWPRIISAPACSIAPSVCFVSSPRAAERRVAGAALPAAHLRAAARLGTGDRRSQRADRARLARASDGDRALSLRAGRAGARTAAISTRAREHLHHAREAQRNFPRGALIRADIALDMNEPELAATLCQRFVELHPQSAGAGVAACAARGARQRCRRNRATLSTRGFVPSRSARAELAYAAIVAGLEQEPFVRDCLPDLLREDPSLGEIVRSIAGDPGQLTQQQRTDLAMALRASCAARSAIAASTAVSRAHRISGNAPAAAAGMRSPRSRCSM